MQAIKYIYFLLSAQYILCLLPACKTHHSNSLIDGIEISSNYNKKPDTLNRVELISLFDSEMSKSGGICWTEAFTGKESGQSIRYKWFSNWATTDELLSLVKSKHTNTKVLAFLALKNRMNVDLKTIVQNNFQDTSSFVETYGCFGNSKRVNSYFLEQTIALFSKAEIIRFRDLISKLNSESDN